MEEKFYYSRNYILFSLVVYVVMVAFFMIFILYPEVYQLKPYIFWAVADRIALVLVVFYGLMFFINLMKNDPVVTVRDRVIAFRSGPLRKCEIGFEKIISATATKGIFRDKDNERIKIRFRKPNDNESVASIYIGGIEGSERLVELLKQHIKFV